MAAAEAAAAAATAELLAMDAKETKKKGSNKKR
jgi:hypothetical protein